MVKKRVQVSFTSKQWALIQRLKGTIGETDADVVRNLVLAWLAEKSLIAAEVKKQKPNNETLSEVSRIERDRQ